MEMRFSWRRRHNWPQTNTDLTLNSQHRKWRFKGAIAVWCKSIYSIYFFYLLERLSYLSYVDLGLFDVFFCSSLRVICGGYIHSVNQGISVLYMFRLWSCLLSTRSTFTTWDHSRQDVTCCFWKPSKELQNRLDYRSAHVLHWVQRARDIKFQNMLTRLVRLMQSEIQALNSPPERTDPGCDHLKPNHQWTISL